MFDIRVFCSLACSTGFAGIYMFVRVDCSGVLGALSKMTGGRFLLLLAWKPTPFAHLNMFKTSLGFEKGAFLNMSKKGHGFEKRACLNMFKKGRGFEKIT